jgi:rSAM/selenodomain-associated transferase 1
VTAEIVVFGRIPAPGRVKTRLAKEVGDAAAAEVYRLLLEHALAEACAAGPAVTLALADAPSADDGWRPPTGVKLEIQPAGDLGSRMLRTFERHFSLGAETVILVGSDLPGLAAAQLANAASALTRVPVVLGPSADGGYWLVGQRRPGHDLFTGVPWSSPEVLQATRLRLLGLKLAHQQLPTLRDVDTLADLEALVTDKELDETLRRRISRLVIARVDES